MLSDCLFSQEENEAEPVEAAEASEVAVEAVATAKRPAKEMEQTPASKSDK